LEKRIFLFSTYQGKSVDETYKGDSYNRRDVSSSKQSADEENSSDEDEASLSSDESLESEESEEETTPTPITTTPKFAPKRRPAMRKKTKSTTTEASDEESTTASPEDYEDASTTVKPQTSNKSKPKKKVKPSTPAPSISNRINVDDDNSSFDDSSIPNQPATNLVPPMPHNYYPHNDFITTTQNSLVPWGFNPAYASFPMAYDYPHPNGPAFSESKAGQGSVAIGNGFASASASAGGSGGTISTSTSPGNGPNYASSAFGTRGGSNPARGPNQQNSGSFVSLRGSFPPSNGQSMEIDANGPSPTGRPIYDGEG
jgi:hypothetical protein